MVGAILTSKKNQRFKLNTKTYWPDAQVTARIESQRINEKWASCCPLPIRSYWIFLWDNIF